jgi:hypothetical protein
VPSSTLDVSKFVDRAGLGVVSFRPKVGPGNGGSYGYVWWCGANGYSAYGQFTKEMLQEVFRQLDRSEPRLAFFRETLGLPASFTECNILYIRNYDENPSRRSCYYVFLKTIEDGILFNLLLEQALGHLVEDRMDDSMYFGFYNRRLKS